MAAVFFVSSTGRDHVIYAFFFRTDESAHDHPTTLGKRGTPPGVATTAPRGVRALFGAYNRDRGEPLGSAPPPTTVRTGPYTAVREVTLTRFDQGRETERFEVDIGEPDREGFAPGDVPRATATAGRVSQLP